MRKLSAALLVLMAICAVAPLALCQRGSSHAPVSWGKKSAAMPGLGLVALYDMLTPGTGTTLTDVWRSTFTGTFSANPPVWTSPIGLTFISDNSNLVTASYNALLNPATVTVIAVVQPQSISGSQALVSSRRSSGLISGYHLYTSSNTFVWAVGRSAGWSVLTATNVPFAAGEWHCVIGTFIDGVQVLYVDGNLEVSGSDKTYTPNASRPTVLGATSDTTPAQYFSGTIALAAIYNRALSAQEITRLYLRSIVPMMRTRGLSLPTPYLTVPPSTSAAATNASAGLTIPTYDEDPRIGHPDVVYVPAGWNGYSYWMAATPYPGGSRENPSICASTDGTTWVVPEGLTNPIVPEPAEGYNSDTDLELGPDNKLYCFYRLYSATPDGFYVKSSSDGVEWSAATQIMTNVASKLSPAIIYTPAGIWMMWYLDTVGKMYHATSSAPDSGWTTPQQCSFVAPHGTMPTGYIPWHLDVRKRNGIYYAALLMREVASEYTLRFHLASSWDGVHWGIAATPVLTIGQTGAWDAHQLYRGTLVPIVGGFDFWYTGIDASTQWRIGRTAITLP